MNLGTLGPVATTCQGMRLRRSLLPAVVVLLASAGSAAAHTESSVVAVPAGEAASLTLAPTHGCGDSPTVAVSVRVPAGGATGGVVEGWTTSQRDADGATIVDWSGGSLPADQVGAFPVSFTAPDTAGELLLFPFVQTCGSGEELPWISGDPESDFPAPRVLVLPAGSAPATSVDDVPPDVPGRNQLAAIVDLDNPFEDEPEPTATTTATTVAEEPTTSTTAEPATDEAADDETTDGESDGGSPWLVVAGVVIIIGAVVAAVVYGVRRTRMAPPSR